MLWRGVGPFFGKPFDGETLAGLLPWSAIDIVEKMACDGKEVLRAGPMAGLVGNIQILNCVNRYAFARHFVEQTRKAVSEVIY